MERVPPRPLDMDACSVPACIRPNAQLHFSETGGTGVDQGKAKSLKRLKSRVIEICISY